MLFSFIKYLNPGWQFNLTPVSTTFPSCKVVHEQAAAAPDNRYQTESARLADTGFRLWNRGVLLQSTQNDLTYLNSLTRPTLQDEYTFVRKYGGTVWATYALLLRLFTFHNPFKELKSYIKTISVKKTNLSKDAITCQEYDNFKSSLIQIQPLVSVIIPTLNRYEYLKDVLLDLEKQTYQHFEVIIVDQSDHFKEGFYTGYSLNIKVIRQAEKKLWTARNRAIIAADADYLLFFDDDSRVEPDWILQHLKCLDYFKADISAGVSFSRVGGKIPENYSYFRWADQFDSGNALVKKTVLETVGLFDEQFNGMRMGDGEFGIRAYLHGCRSISNHQASRVHLKAASGGLREMSGWDAFHTKLREPKPVPSVMYLYKKYFPKTLARNVMFQGMLLSNVSYKHKGKSKMLLLSMLIGLIKWPVLYMQYRASDKIAQQMLRKNEIKQLVPATAK